MIFGNQYFLAIGDTLVFPEQYTNVETVKRTNVETIYPKFFTKSNLNLLHRMVETYYTTYKSVMRLFVTNAIEKLLERENKLTKARSARDEN